MVKWPWFGQLYSIWGVFQILEIKKPLQFRETVKKRYSNFSNKVIKILISNEKINFIITICFLSQNVWHRKPFFCPKWTLPFLAHLMRTNLGIAYCRRNRSKNARVCESELHIRHSFNLFIGKWNVCSFVCFPPMFIPRLQYNYHAPDVLKFHGLSLTEISEYFGDT